MLITLSTSSAGSSGEVPPIIEPMEVRVFPNPAGGWVRLDCPGSFDFEVFDGRGSLVARETGVFSNHQMSTANWPVGIYTIRILAQRRVIVKKLIKTNRN